jgi:hypothetical protein
MEGSQPRLRRRALLGSVAAGVAGIAGCTTNVFNGGDENSTASGTGTDQSPTASATSTPDTSGATIPSYPYRETGVEPLEAKPDPEALNPVLEPGHVTDGQAEFVADPFMFVTEDDEWHMFFEVMLDRGVIGHATSDDRGVTWSYDQIVLERPDHVSFPYVFKWDGEYYMMTGEVTPMVRLHKATDFPTKWTEVDILFNSTHFGPNVNDTVPFRWNDEWWMLAGGGENNLYAFHADELTGEWRPHENNPVVENRPTAARPGGRPIVREDHILIPYQDVKEFYGEKVRGYRIDELSPTTFSDSELEQSPLLDGTEEDGAWNSVRMHHYDPWYLGEGEGWRVAVDGNGDGGWSIGIYRVPEQ